MIFQVDTKDEIRYITARNMLHLIQSYYEQYHEDECAEIESIKHIDDETAKTMILKCDDGKEIHDISLFNLACGTDFMVVGGTEYYPL